MAERRKLHPRQEVNMRRLAAQERSVEAQGYVVKWGNGAKKYFDKYREAQEFKAMLVKGGEWTNHVHIINIARERTPLPKVKKQLEFNVGGRLVSGAGLTSTELALMVKGRMCEATSHQFRCAFPTMEMRKAAQRALKHMIHAGNGRMTEEVKEALALKLPRSRKE